MTGYRATSQRWWYLPYTVVGQFGLNWTIDTLSPVQRRTHLMVLPRKLVQDSENPT